MRYRSVFLVTSSHPGWRDILSLIDGIAKVQVVGQAPTPTLALRRITVLRPDVVLVPAELDGISILPLVAALRATAPEQTLVIIGEHCELADLGRLIELQIGGYLLWNELSDPILHYCLRVGISGAAAAFSQSVVSLLAERFHGQRATALPSVSVELGEPLASPSRGILVAL